MSSMSLELVVLMNTISGGPVRHSHLSADIVTSSRVVTDFKVVELKVSVMANLLRILDALATAKNFRVLR